MKILSMQSLISVAEFPVGSRTQVLPLAHPCRQSQAARKRDHGPIVRTEFDARKVQLRPKAAHHLTQAVAQALVCAHAAGYDQTPVTGLLERTPALFGEGLDHRLLKATRDVRAGRVVQFAAPQGY
jgi:hypothetical protein